MLLNSSSTKSTHAGFVKKLVALHTAQVNGAQGGFTLLELIITMVLIGILSLMIPGVFVSWLQSSTLAQSNATLLGNAESALDTITTDIRLSGNADPTNRWPDPNGPGGNQYGWQSNSGTLVLAKAATDNSNNIIFSDPTKYISLKDDEVYYLSGSTLYRRTISSGQSGDSALTTCPSASATPSCPADRTIATGVTNFYAQYYDANENQVSPGNARSVQLAITLTGQSGSRTISASYSTRMVFRNE